ncbi:MAG: conserved phage C-terminal domain-containing protein [Clostridium sp.]|uniref:conserved phage C-terminal domain-containing protein n=1 Tax=Clostridium sp. TaxID=1506 RepID=UPI00306E1A01
MKYTIMGFSQQGLVELGLDVIDATILRYFIDFKDAKGMKIEVVEGKVYYWIRYDGVINQLPILNMKKCTVQSRFFKLRDAGVLTHYVKREGGTYSYFGLGEKYSKLIYGTSTAEKKSQEVHQNYVERCENEVEDNQAQRLDVKGENNKWDSYGVQSEDSKMDNYNFKDGSNQGDSYNFKIENNQRDSYKLKTIDENLRVREENLQCVEKTLQPYIEKPTTNNYSIKDSSIKNNIVFLRNKCVEIVEYFNERTGKKFKSSTKETVKLIQERFKEGFTLEDFKKVIDNMKAKWTSTKFEEYLVPTTLFGSKFENYLNLQGQALRSGFKRGNVVSSYNTNENNESKSFNNQGLKAILLEDM